MYTCVNGIYTLVVTCTFNSPFVSVVRSPLCVCVYVCVCVCVCVCIHLSACSTYQSGPVPKARQSPLAHSPVKAEMKVKSRDSLVATKNWAMLHHFFVLLWLAAFTRNWGFTWNKPMRTWWSVRRGFRSWNLSSNRCTRCLSVHLFFTWTPNMMFHCFLFRASSLLCPFLLALSWWKVLFFLLRRSVSCLSKGLPSFDDDQCLSLPSFTAKTMCTVLYIHVISFPIQCTMHSLVLYPKPKETKALLVNIYTRHWENGVCYYAVLLTCTINCTIILDIFIQVLLVFYGASSMLWINDTNND